MKINIQNKKESKRIIKILSLIFWLFIWFALSLIINMEIILPSPYKVIITLLELCVKKDFWISILLSSSRIIIGFLMALIMGIITAIISCKFWVFETIIDVPMKLIKVTPIASFVILALLWVKGKNLSVLISFLMVMPIIYTNVKEGIKTTDVKLLEMARMFNIKKINIINKIYIPAIMPHLSSAITVGLGFCWKSGIAAEVIGIPKKSIGFNLYEAKINLMTKEVMAWTVVIIIISIVFEKLVFFIVERWRIKWINT